MNKPKFFYGIAVSAWTAILCYLHFLPAKEIKLDGWYLKYHMDKVAHMIMFAVLFVLLYKFISSYLKKPIKTLIYSGLIVLFYGAMLEFAQGTIVVGRTSDSLDFLADASGILVGFAIIKLFSWDHLVS